MNKPKSCLVVGNTNFPIATKFTRVYDKDAQVKPHHFGIVVIDANARGALQALQAIKQTRRYPRTIVHHHADTCLTDDNGKERLWQLKTSLSVHFPFAEFVQTSGAEPWTVIREVLDAA